MGPRLMRVQRTIAFVDLCGFTPFTERHRDEQVVLVLAQLRSALREAAARRGVRVVKWLGDGAMLSSTHSAELVALLIEIDERMTSDVPSLAVRSGIDAGPVIMFEGDDYIGTCVNTASRLCDRAEPHEVLATVGVSLTRPTWIEAQSAGPLDIRGIAHALDVDALRLAEGGTVRDPVCGLVISPHLGVRAIGNVIDIFCTQACADSWSEAHLLAGEPRASTHPARAHVDGDDTPRSE
jgi:adenylate cyclase